MPTIGTAPQLRDSHVNPLYAGALIVATVFGLCALFALAAGSPLQFGVALAIFGGSWIAADFIDRTGERAHAQTAHQYAVKAPRPPAGALPCRVVYVGRREQVISPTSRRVATRVAA